MSAFMGKVHEYSLKSKRHSVTKIGNTFSRNRSQLSFAGHGFALSNKVKPRRLKASFSSNYTFS